MANGVSLLHGETAHKTWANVVGLNVGGLTNGVHMPTWVGPDMRALFEKHGANFDGGTEMEVKTGTSIHSVWAGAANLDARQIWEAHLAQKLRLAHFVNERCFSRAIRMGADPSEIDAVLEAFNPKAFTICFARRFATYKRATLLFSNSKRLGQLLGNTERPVQIVFAGKAHPADAEGQTLISEVAQFTRESRFQGKVFLIEDYDMEVGRMLTQGADLWLNNPRRPLEASGTSGMKAAANGVPNASTLDGWWDEAYTQNPRNGFAIGMRDVFRTVRLQDRADAAELYRVLEDEVVPMFFSRSKDDFPTEWVEVMRQSIATSLYAFSTRRMLQDYLAKMYDAGG